MQRTADGGVRALTNGLNSLWAKRKYHRLVKKDRRANPFRGWTMKHAALLNHIRRRFPDATTMVTEFSSGAVDIAIRRGDRVVVVQHADDMGYGVSVVQEGDPGPSGHDATFLSLSDACDEVDALLL